MTFQASQMEKIRVLLVDDHASYRSGLRRMLEYAGQPIEVVGEAGDGAAAIEAAERLQPDVILLDIRMPGLDGVSAAEQILASSPHIRVLMLTTFEQDDTVYGALRAGAVGYLSKSASKAEILRAITGAMNGEALFGSAITRRVLDHFHHSPSVPIPTTGPIPNFTEREIAVLELLAEQLNNHEIAARLAISEKTVRNHVSAISTKLQASSRAELIQRARALRLKP